MPVGLWNLQWLDHNAQRRYPFMGSAELTDKSGSFKIPDDFLVELDLPVHASMDTSPQLFFVRVIMASPTGYAVTVSYETGDGYYDVATALIPSYNVNRNTTFALGGVSPFEDTIGKLVVGRLDSINEQPPGLWEFDPAATRLEPDCIRPQLRGVQALIVVDGSERSSPLTGDIEIVAGSNMQIVPVTISGESPKLIFSAIEGAGLTQQCVCEGDNEVAPCVRYINDIPPAPDGKFYIIGDDSISVTQGTNSIVLKDTVSKPCCSCTELEAITRDLERFHQQRVDLQHFVSFLETSVNQMSMMVLGAKLGDSACGNLSL